MLILGRVGFRQFGTTKFLLKGCRLRSLGLLFPLKVFTVTSRGFDASELKPLTPILSLNAQCAFLSSDI